MKLRMLFASFMLLSGLSADALPQDEAQAQKQKPESFSALAYLPAGAGVRMAAPGANTSITIYVKRYSTDAEANTLSQALLSGGQDAVIKLMHKMKAIGKVSLVGRVGFFDLKFIRTRPAEGGRIIIGACDRPIQFLEAANAGRSTDYKIGIVTLQLKEKSEDHGEKTKEEGEGSLIYAAKVKVIEGNKVEIENYGIEPARLLGVRKL